MSHTRTLAAAGITAACLVLTGSLYAQVPQNAIQVFAPVNINSSFQNQGVSTFGTNIMKVTCPIEGAITARIAQTSDGSGYLLEDNLLYLKNLDNPTLTPADGADQGINGGLNVCRSGDPNSPGNANATNCFQLPYEGAAGSFIGKNPDSLGPDFLGSYGVPPIDVSAYLAPGTQQLRFDLIDWGGLLGSSSLWLVTNCSQNGIASGGSVTGIPISGTNPTPEQLTQTFPFDSTNGQLINFLADFSPSNTAGTLTIVDGSTPTVTDTLVTPADFKAMIAGTSLAPSDCIPLTGELDANGNPSCKVFTITCVNSQTNVSAGTNCPQSTARNSLFSSKFDTDPAFIAALPPGTGFGFLMGSDNWTGSLAACQFTPNTPDAGLLCPQNVATEFLGDPRSGGTTKSLNSSFIAVRGVPLPSTAVTVTPMSTYGWTNSSSPNVHFVSSPATYSGPNPLNGFIAAPIASLTYGVDNTAANNTSLPVPGDITITNAATCPAVPTPGATSFVSNAALGPLSNGQHALHYFATDCAATEELLYTVQPANPDNWASFKVQSINVDTQAPTAAFNPQPPANNVVVLNSAVSVPFVCSDSTSGLAVCGTSAGTTLGTPGVATYNGSATVPTNVIGSTTSLAVYAKDLAGNASNSSTVNYTVQYSTAACLGAPGHQILPPINVDGSSVFKRGRSIPAKFRVCDANGVSIGAPGTVKNVTVRSTKGTRNTREVEINDDDCDTTFRWDPVNQQWIWNIRSKSLSSGYTYTFVVTLKDNSTIQFQFGLK